MNDQLLALYARHQTRRNLRPGSILKCSDTLRRLARFHARPLLELEPDDIDRWVEAIPRAARTRYNMISLASGFYEWAVEEGLAETNPTRRVDRPRLHRGLPRPIPHEDLSIAVHCARPMVRAWLLLAALEGLRCQEIAGVCREHIWDREEPGVLLVAEAKGGQQRFVPLHPDALEALRAMGMPRTGPLFRNRYGRPYSPARVSQLGNAHLHALGIEATMHQLRHRFGTDVYALSQDIRVTQELMGHQSVNSTAIYTAINSARATAVVHQLAVRPLAA